jgi:hypothetical protein
MNCSFSQDNIGGDFDEPEDLMFGTSDKNSEFACGKR